MIDKKFFGNLKIVTLEELAKVCDFKIIGDKSKTISNVSTLKNATNSDLAFFGNRKYISDLQKTEACAVILTEANIKHLPTSVVGLVCTNVMIEYAKAIKVMFVTKQESGNISSTAVIHETAKIGSDCNIGNYVIIGENVKIGNNSIIESNTVIENNCTIGNNAMIKNNVSISHSIIGKNVIINSGARIGESGFGIIPTGKEMIYVPQLGRVIIGDRVRIGANTTIDRGSIEDTSIGNDSIIDNLVQFGHNVVIGERSIIVAQVGIAGSTHVGNDCILAGQVGIAGHITVGDRVIIAAKSGVAASIESGKIVGGIPAVDVGIWKRQVVFLKLSATKKKMKIKMWSEIWKGIWNKIIQKKS